MYMYLITFIDIDNIAGAVEKKIDLGFNLR